MSLLDGLGYVLLVPRKRKLRGNNFASLGLYPLNGLLLLVVDHSLLLKVLHL
jgi:hypothetical protein